MRYARAWAFWGFCVCPRGAGTSKDLARERRPPYGLLSVPLKVRGTVVISFLMSLGVAYVPHLPLLGFWVKVWDQGAVKTQLPFVTVKAVPR